MKSLSLSFCLLAAVTLTACSSVADSIPTVKIEKRKPRAQVEQASYVTRTESLPAEAALVCENANMRAKAVDNDDSNDTARVMVVQDGQKSSHLLAEVAVNCRDYFARKSAYPDMVAPQQAQFSRASTIPDVTPTLKKQTRQRGYTYIVQRGDTVWDIAREHCTDVKTIARLNGLGRGNVLAIDQRLELPVSDCD